MTRKAAAGKTPPRGRGGYTVVERPLMSERTTMRIGGEALAEIRVHDPAALEKIPELLKKIGGAPAVLGKGSNLLVTEKPLPLVLVTLDTDRRPYVMMDSDRVLLRVNADLPLPVLLGKAAKLGLSGLEGLSGIPGSVGGALAMNAGSYGVCMADVTRSAKIFSPQTGIAELAAEEFTFAYRHSSPRAQVDWFIAVGVTVELTRDEPDAIRRRMAETLAKKRAGQPITAKSAGCVFKNPHPEHPAGRLLEEAGMRGKGLGGLRFSPVHANFLVNEGGGRFAEAEELIAKAQEAVKKHSGYSLELEVRIWP